MKLRILALGALLALSQQAFAEDCAWLSNAALDKAFPQYAPWNTMVGGTAGHCQFTSNPRKSPNIFSAIQMVKASPKEAAELVKTMKAAMVATQTIEPAPRLGAEGFFYRPKEADGSSDGKTLFFVGHHKQVAINGSLTFQDPVTPETIKSAETLLLSAFVLADDPEALEAAANCPYFDKATLKKLLPGKDMTQQTYGSNSCMANAGTSVVLVSIIPSRGQKHADEHCTSKPVPELGPSGIANFNCKGGNPHSKLGYEAGGNFIEYSLAPGREPTDAEHALLIDLAVKAPARAR
jgi:hypothetical protein